MIDRSRFVNHFDFDQQSNEILSEQGSYWFEPVDRFVVNGINEQHHLVQVVDNLIPLRVREVLIQGLRQNAWQAVGLDGYANQPYEQIGNYRLSNYNEGFAQALWKRLKPFVEIPRRFGPLTPTDHDGHFNWRAVGINPLMRFIRYKEGGQLVAHYDASYVESHERRSLMSLVIYLTSNSSGATRFIRDPQAGKPMDQMNFSDWDRVADTNEVLFSNQPQAGSAILFDHRILHDGQPIDQGEEDKIIIRTDLMFERT